MKLVGASNQQVPSPLYRADGTITTGGTPQLVLGRSQARSFLMLQNLSAGPLFFEHGAGHATAALTSGVVSSVTVTNAGFNFTYPPVIEFLGGGAAGNSTYTGLGQPGAPAPSKPARAHCVMTGSAPNQSISSITVDDGGALYSCPPYVFIRSSDLDPNGCSVPSASVGMLLGGQSAPFVLNGTACWTDAIAVWGATTGQAFLARWMD